jgi:methionyl-tRNA formyltransferase
MRILFIGTVQFSLSSLKLLLTNNANIVGVCTRKKNNFNSDYADLIPVCTSNNIPFITEDDINSEESLKWIESKKPDIIFCFGWSSLIKERLLNIPPMGIVGFHPAELPKNRGRHPIIWALFLGLTQTASTFFFMDKGADSGDILSQITIPIDKNDDANLLYQNITNIALNQINEFLPKLQENTYKRIKQNHSFSNIWRKRNEFDGQIDFRMNSIAIYNLVRALTHPYVGAHLTYNGIDIKIWKVSIGENNAHIQNLEPGKILSINENIIEIKTYDSTIKLVDHEFRVLPKVGDYL